MLVQIWWTESIKPKFTQEQKIGYKKFKLDQVLPVGKEVDGKCLLHAVCDKKTVTPLLKYLEDAGKNPVLLRIANKKGETIGEVDDPFYKQFFDDEIGENKFYGWEIRK